MENLRPEHDIISQWDATTNEVLVSVVCAAFNHEAYIEKAIKGFLIQKTNFRYEIIIRDDASTDNTASIIKKYQKKYPKIIKPVFETENQLSKGVKPLDAILEYTSGKYIAICEGDDFWTDPDKIQIQFDYLENNPDIVVTGHDAYTVNTKGHIIVKSRLANKHKRDYTGVEMMHGKAYMLFQNLMFRKHRFIDIPEKRMVSNGDVFLISFLGQFGGSHYHTNIKPSCHVRHEGGVWSGSDSKKRLEMQINSYFWIYKYYKRVNQSNISKIYWGIYLRKVFQNSSRIDLVREFFIRTFLIREIYHYLKAKR